jgi:hypothetical protein
MRIATCILLSIAAFSLAGADSGNKAEDKKAPAIPADHVEFFEKHIRPVLIDHCFKCHSMEEGKKVKGGLALDSRDALLKGGESGPAIVPGNPDKSPLITAIRYTEHDLQMPPKDPLPKEVVAKFEQWVKMGAPDPRIAGAEIRPVKKEPAYNFEAAKKFWSFRPLSQPAVPQVSNLKSEISNPVDAFVFAKLEEKGLAPNKAIDKRTLLRRATYDLTGLPPTPDEVEAFLADDSPSALVKVIDRLLASPAYGEKWGRHWLDLVRYADTSGCNSDYPVPSARLYRNYVIDSFNRDKPYDQFVREQLAGDLLPHRDREERNEHVIATGYLAIARRFGSRASEFHLTIEDMIDNMGKTMLGLSVSCARCHDHKYDPIPNEDYYALYGIFNSARYAFPGTEIYKHPKDFVPLGTEEEAEKLIDYEAKVAELDDLIEQLVQEQRNAIRGPATQPTTQRVRPAEEDNDNPDKPAKREPAPPRPADAPPLAEQRRPPLPFRRSISEVKADLQDAQQQLRRLEFRPPETPKAYAAAEGLPQDAKLHRKGDRSNLGDVVPRGYLTILGGQKLPKDHKSSGRLELANWITRDSQALFARVMVNRIWQYHFGKGLVQTPNDFGARGKPPTHPELLDYLANRFIESGYSIKSMHRLVMLSQAYQLSSEHNEQNFLKDPNNDYLWRFDRRRLSAEEVRDSMLVLGGALDPDTEGEHPFPPENEWKYTQHRPYVAVYPSTKRSVYLMQQRIKKHPFLEIFDGADPNAPTAFRPIATTPMQALFVMNDPFAHEMADKFATRVGLTFGDEEKRIDYAHRLAFSRSAMPDEIAAAREFLREIEQKLSYANVPWDQRPRKALASYCRVLFGSNEFLYLD